MTEWRLFVYPVLAYAVLSWMHGLWNELQEMKKAERANARP